MDRNDCLITVVFGKRAFILIYTYQIWAINVIVS